MHGVTVYRLPISLYTWCYFVQINQLSIYMVLFCNDYPSQHPHGVTLYRLPISASVWWYSVQITPPVSTWCYSVQITYSSQCCGLIYLGSRILNYLEHHNTGEMFAVKIHLSTLSIRLHGNRNIFLEGNFVYAWQK